MSGAISPAVVNLCSMRTRGWIIPVAALAAALVAAGSVAQPSSARAIRAVAPPEPVVIELFTAQGCADCPEANARLESVATEPGVIALTYAVDYWDYLGWEDTFARPEFAQRQRAYRKPLRLRDVATPQIVIDGRRQVVGAGVPALQSAIDEVGARRVFPPEIEFRTGGDRVGVGRDAHIAEGAGLWNQQDGAEVEERTEFADQDPLSDGLVADGPHHEHVAALLEPRERERALLVREPSAHERAVPFRLELEREDRQG